MRALYLALVAGLLTSPAAHAAPPAGTQVQVHVRAIGDVGVDSGVLTARGYKATLVIGPADADLYRVTAEVKPADKATRVFLLVMPADPSDANKPAALYGSFYRDAPGLKLQADSSQWDAAKRQWGSDNVSAWYNYWPAPTEKASLALMEGSGIAPRSLRDRWLKLRVEAERRHIRFWLDGLLVHQVERPAAMKGPVAVVLAQGDQVRNVALAPLAESVYLPVDLTLFAHERPAAPLGKQSLVAAGVPFELASGGNGLVDLHRAQWIEERQDPQDTYENYEGGPPVVHDPRMPLLRVPSMDYLAAHVLAVADDDAATTANFTLRAGRYGHSGQVVFHSFPAAVPRRSEAGKVPPALQTPAGPLFHVRVPLGEAFAQDIDHYWIDIELTKEVRLTRRVPDPNRTRSRPLGPPSGVHIAALTLERSPLQTRLTSKEAGHAFVEPQKPAFALRLTNITSVPQAYELVLALTHHDGTQHRATGQGTVPAGRAADVILEAPTKPKRGYHDVTVTLRDGGARTLLERRTSCCLLPPDTRKHRATSPIGTWDFCGGHFTSNNPDINGPLYVKAGLRWGMPHFKPEDRKRYGVLAALEPNVYQTGVQGWEDTVKSIPDLPPIALLFHENFASLKQVMRVPELFTDQPPYKFDAEEEKTFKKMLEAAQKSARAIKAKYPHVHLRLGNGALPMKEALYQAKFPAELFDSAGNESPALGRPPEAQPPDFVAFNASIWMDRQLLDAYGYKDKPVTLCYETCYTTSMPGKEQEQADYLVRHGLHALAWNMPQIKLGQICDQGNGFYFSQYGPIGLCRARPELNVKPPFVAVATLTHVLDGARFARVVPLGSPALYGLEFTRPDGTQAHAFWTLRGKRSVRLLMDRPGPWTLINDQGAETPVRKSGGRQPSVELELTPSPVYLVGAGKVVGADTSAPQYTDKPAGKGTVLAPLADLMDWTTQTDRDPELEYYDFVGPRRKGDFAFAPVASFEGKERVLQVTPRPIKHGKDTMPMYVALAHKQGIPVPGTPTEVGAWVNGNGGWGRLIFELHDASGQRWISIGAEQKDVPRKWVEDLVPPGMRPKWNKPAINDSNTDDVLGLSRINFDGWRWLAFPLPGNYPGEKHPWPANSQWRWDKDGVVHYPLILTRLIVELPAKVLHVKTFAPPPRPEIYLKDLTVGQDDRQLGYALGPDR
jgi:hypothetical protein